MAPIKEGHCSVLRLQLFDFHFLFWHLEQLFESTTRQAVNWVTVKYIQSRAAVYTTILPFYPRCTRYKYSSRLYPPNHKPQLACNEHNQLQAVPHSTCSFNSRASSFATILSIIASPRHPASALVAVNTLFSGSEHWSSDERIEGRVQIRGPSAKLSEATTKQATAVVAIWRIEPYQNGLKQSYSLHSTTYLGIQRVRMRI